MRITTGWQQRQIAGCLVIFLAVPFAEAANTRPQPVQSGQQAQTAPTTQSQSSDAASDNSPTSTSQPEPSPNGSDSASSNESNQGQSSGTLPSAPQQQQNGTSNPVGTAAAPYEKTTGVAASRPAGAVVAPAKQKRSRSFLIRVGLIVGACVAVGTVVALSAGSPSRP
jgi:cobalamin biosynthesis Mg chelatase CobN